MPGHSRAGTRRPVFVDLRRQPRHHELPVVATGRASLPRHPFCRDGARRSAAHQESGEPKRAIRLEYSSPPPLRPHRDSHREFAARHMVIDALSDARLSRHTRRVQGTIRRADTARRHGAGATTIDGPFTSVHPAQIESRRGHGTSKKNRASILLRAYYEATNCL